MKLYCLWITNDIEPKLVGIFTSKEKAQNYAKNEIKYCPTSIDEWNADPEKQSSKKLTSEFVSKHAECEQCKKESPYFFCCHKTCGNCPWRKACLSEYKFGKCPKE